MTSTEKQLVSDNFRKNSDIIFTVLIGLTVFSLLINIPLLLYYIVKKKYINSHQMTFLNIVVADILYACSGAFISSPGLYL